MNSVLNGFSLIAGATVASLHDKVVIALIGAAGGTVGGIVSPILQHFFESRKTKKASRAVARILADRLGDVALTLEAIRDDWPEEEDLTVGATDDDLRALADRDENAFDAFSDARSHLKSVRMKLGSGSQPDSQGSLDLISRTRDAVGEAERKLKAVR